MSVQIPSRWSISSTWSMSSVAAEPRAARAVDRDGVLGVGDRPAELAEVRAVGEPARLTEEVEDPLAAVVLLRDLGDAGHAPDGVLVDHLEERARLAADEGVEDATDALERVYRSSGAIVRP